MKAHTVNSVHQVEPPSWGLRLSFSQQTGPLHRLSSSKLEKRLLIPFLWASTPSCREIDSESWDWLMWAGRLPGPSLPLAVACLGFRPQLQRWRAINRPEEKVWHKDLMFSEPWYTLTCWARVLSLCWFLFAWFCSCYSCGGGDGFWERLSQTILALIFLLLSPGC